jgi:predicted aspartyl protease
MKKGLFAVVAVLFLSRVAYSQSEFVDLPFSLTDGHVIVQAMVNGHGPFRMALDTGASTSIIDASRVADAGLKLGSKVPVHSFGESAYSGFRTRIQRLDVGTLAVRDLETIALANFPQTYLREFDGILGYSFLRHRVIQIDYPKQILRVYLKAPSGAVAGTDILSGRTVLPFQLRGNGIMIRDVRIDEKSVVASVDTGAASAFLTTSNAAVRLGLRLSSDGRIEKIGNTVTVLPPLLSVQTISIGTLKSESPEVTLRQGKPSDKIAWDLNIGGGFLKDYVVTIDYIRRKLVLQAHV